MIKRLALILLLSMAAGCSDTMEVKECDVLLVGDSQVFLFPVKEGWCKVGYPGAKAKQVLNAVKLGALKPYRYELLVVAVGANDIIHGDGTEQELYDAAEATLEFHEYGPAFITNVFNSRENPDHDNKAHYINSLTNAEYVPAFDFIDEYHLGPQTYENWIHLITITLERLRRDGMVR